MNKRIVTVFGSSRAEPLSPLYQRAHLLGRTVAELGWTLCNGGYGGTMEAAARGAFEAEGHTIGVICTRFGRSKANAFIQQEIPTFDLLQRLNTLIRLGRAYVVLPGGTGTLAELALTWELLNKKLITGERPIMVLGDTWRPVVDCIAETQPSAQAIQVVEDVETVKEILNNLDI